jgi:hypothetical protein
MTSRQTNTLGLILLLVILAGDLVTGAVSSSAAKQTGTVSHSTGVRNTNLTFATTSSTFVNVTSVTITGQLGDNVSCTFSTQLFFSAGISPTADFQIVDFSSGNQSPVWGMDDFMGLNQRTLINVASRLFIGSSSPDTIAIQTRVSGAQARIVLGPYAFLCFNLRGTVV